MDDTRPYVRVAGRYVLHDEIASGGMATVYFGRLLGPVGFSRTVAVKQPHRQFARDPELVSMFIDEARVAARIRHSSVVSIIDVVATEGEVFLVMEYVQGESLARLLRTAHGRDERVSPRIACTILSNVLHGLHAAHEATSERGEPLQIVHRDVSPQNILVGVDGVARVIDFGIAKAMGRLHTTRGPGLKGKLSYVAPEQIEGRVDSRTDIYAAAVVLWEALTGRRLFEGEDATVLADVLAGEIPKPSSIVPGLPPVLDEITLRGLARDPSRRFASAREMALALESATGFAPPSQVGEWVSRTAAASLARRSARIAEIESDSAGDGLACRGAPLAHRHGERTRAGDSGRGGESRRGEPRAPRRSRGLRNGIISFALGAALVAIAVGGVRGSAPSVAVRPAQQAAAAPPVQESVAAPPTPTIAAAAPSTRPPPIKVNRPVAPAAPWGSKSLEARNVLGTRH